ncbi:SDR family NAD(P)-dependent oxidoreductase [Paenibacillus sp. 8b26]|uniref:SDR family NAD(P)-dependent oxidoreductase n=1 Tax=Paenibacillus sp. 8b26 TaxID=3424133 RepID=UPI003D651447
MNRLIGKVAIITGAASGMGAAETRLFVQEDAKIVATDVQKELLEKVVKEINVQHPGSAASLTHDESRFITGTELVIDGGQIVR